MPDIRIRPHWVSSTADAVDFYPLSVLRASGLTERLRRSSRLIRPQSAAHLPSAFECSRASRGAPQKDSSWKSASAVGPGGGGAWARLSAIVSARAAGIEIPICESQGAPTKARNAIEPKYSLNETGKSSMPGRSRLQGEKTPVGSTSRRASAGGRIAVMLAPAHSGRFVRTHRRVMSPLELRRFALACAAAFWLLDEHLAAWRANRRPASPDTICE